MTEPHPQVIAIARLCENLAPTVTAALDRIRREQANLGWNDHTPASSASSTPNPPPEYDAYGRMLEPVTLTTVERSAQRRTTLGTHQWQIHENITAIARIIYHTQDVCAQVFGGDTPTEPVDKPRCWAGNLDGYMIARADGGWSDLTCTNIPRRGDAGICDACYARHIRYRKRLGLPPLSEQHPAA